MKLFEVYIFLTTICSILAIIFFIITFILAKKEFIRKEGTTKSTVYSAMATLISAVLSVLSYSNIPIPTPVILPLDNDTKTYTDNLEITIKSDKSNFLETYYSLNGKDPQDGIKYTNEFTITKSATVCARNKFLWIWSDISRNAYFINKADETDEIEDSIIKDPPFNLEDDIENIQRNYNSFQENKNNAIQNFICRQILIYYLSNEVASIEIQSGYRDINYSRIYFFDDENKLYFAFIFDKTKENRLYFKDNVLIRYIDENGDIYDLYDNLDTCEWDELALNESYEILNDVS